MRRPVINETRKQTAFGTDLGYGIALMRYRLLYGRCRQCGPRAVVKAVETHYYTISEGIQRWEESGHTVEKS